MAACTKPELASTIVHGLLQMLLTLLLMNTNVFILFCKLLTYKLAHHEIACAELAGGFEQVNDLENELAIAPCLPARGRCYDDLLRASPPLDLSCS